LCYLATFFLGINSVGLFLYSARLAFNSLMEGDTDKENESKVVVSQVHQIQHLIVLQMEQS
jgi:hypothetical protein